MAETAYGVTLDTIRAMVRDFILKNFLFDGQTHQLEDDASLLENGVVDATGVVELMLFVEDGFGLHVAESDLIPENFDSIENITNYIARQLANM